MNVKQERELLHAIAPKGRAADWRIAMHLLDEAQLYLLIQNRTLAQRFFDAATPYITEAKRHADLPSA